MTPPPAPEQQPPKEYIVTEAEISAQETLLRHKLPHLRSRPITPAATEKRLEQLDLSERVSPCNACSECEEDCEGFGKRCDTYIWWQKANEQNDALIHQQARAEGAQRERERILRLVEDFADAGFYIRGVVGDPVTRLRAFTDKLRQSTTTPGSEARDD